MVKEGVAYIQYTLHKHSGNVTHGYKPQHSGEYSRLLGTQIVWMQKVFFSYLAITLYYSFTEERWCCDGVSIAVSLKHKTGQNPPQ